MFDLAFSRTANKRPPPTQAEIDAAKQRKFVLYGQARIKALESLDLNPWSSDNPDFITLEEMDFRLEMSLKVSPEARYKHKKSLIMYHPSSAMMRNLEAPDRNGCDFNHRCIPDCPYCADEGRIEDEQVIKEHEKLVSDYRKNGLLIEFPADTELDAALRIIESFVYQKLHE